jgi:phage-related protein
VTRPESPQTIIEWLYDTLDTLKGLDLEVRRDVGQALRFAQQGGKHPSTKPLKGFGGSTVLEVIAHHDTDTYRCVYTVRFAGVIYVLHVFQKKSKKGGETPKPDMDLVRKRLADAEAHYKAHYGNPKGKKP